MSCVVVTATVTRGALSGACGAAQRNAFGKVGGVWECPAAHAFVSDLVGNYSFDATRKGDCWNLVVPAGGKEGTLKVVVKDTGVVSVSGRLEGTTYSATTTLKADGRVDFFAKGVQLSGQL